MKKLSCNCGHKEPCFEKGEQWGHFEGVMCANLYEKDWYENGVRTSKVEWCGKYDCSVQSYSTQLQHRKLIGGGVK